MSKTSRFTGKLGSRIGDQGLKITLKKHTGNTKFILDRVDVIVDHRLGFHSISCWLY